MSIHIRDVHRILALIVTGCNTVMRSKSIGFQEPTPLEYRRARAGCLGVNVLTVPVPPLVGGERE
jgi:hypothetical protein